MVTLGAESGIGGPTDLLRLSPDREARRTCRLGSAERDGTQSGGPDGSTVRANPGAVREEPDATSRESTFLRPLRNRSAATPMPPKAGPRTIPAFR
jgi:hypothetical protein